MTGTNSIQDRIAEVLAEHRWERSNSTFCSCGADLTSPETGIHEMTVANCVKWLAAHQAAMLAPLIRETQRDLPKVRRAHVPEDGSIDLDVGLYEGTVVSRAATPTSLRENALELEAPANELRLIAEEREQDE